MQQRVKVLYIGGGGRSGSTLLLRLLGRAPNSVAVGELVHLWDWTLAENQLCGCGQPVTDCPFWGAVLAEAFGGLDRVDIPAMRELTHAVQGYRFLPMLALPALRSRKQRDTLQAYTEMLAKLYRAIHQLSGGRVIVDSSKNPWYALVLHRIPDLDVRVLHLVRDPRAVAYSWQRRKVRPEVHWQTQYMSRYSAWRAALKWNLANGFAPLLRAAGVPQLGLRYETLTAHPAETLQQVARFVGEDWSGVNFLGGEAGEPRGLSHTVAGNPDRFQGGPIHIRPDLEWQAEMPARQKALVTALTWPLLVAYGYHRLPRVARSAWRASETQG